MLRTSLMTTTVLATMFACSTYSAQESDKGGLGEPCRDDGTCNTELTCAGGICRAVATEDASTTDTVDATALLDSGVPDDASMASDARADATKPEPCDALASQAPAGVVECVDTSCLPGRICCGTTHQCATTCTDFQVVMPCDGKDDCNTGVCCADLGANPINTAICPRSGSFSKLKTRCAASCGQSEVELCTSTTCGAGKRCTRTLVQLGGGGGANFNISYCE